MSPLGTFRDVDLVNDSVRALIRELLQLPPNRVRPGNQAAPIPKDGLFATVTLLALAGVGQDATDYYNPARTAEIAAGVASLDAPAAIATPNSVGEIVRGLRLATFSLQVYRAGALTLLTRLRGLCASYRGTELFAARNLGLASVGAVRDLSAVDGPEIEERAAVDVGLHFVATEIIETPTFGTFPLDISDGESRIVKEIFEP